MHMTGLARVAAAAAAFLVAGELAASEPRVWKLEGAAARKAGELEDVSLGWDGTLSLAPHKQALHKWTSAQVWSLARDRRGVVYAGTGNDGLLYALEPGREPSVLFDAEEPIVQALSVDERGVTAATSPSGKVYRIEGPGKARVLFDPPETYIWALARTAQGDLLIATGDPAVLYRIDAKGEAQAILKSEERHFRALAVGPAGDVFVGTSESAYIYRLTPQKEAYVLYDAPGREVSALALGGDGTLYAAALGGPAPSAPETPAAAPPQDSDAPEPEAAATVTASAADEPQVAPAARPQAAPKQTRGGARNSEIFRIRPDGYPESLWRSATEVIYALAVEEGGSLLAASGEPAALLRISPQGKSDEWSRLEGAQATQLLGAGPGEWVVGTSNIGSVVRVGPARAAQGTYTSPVKDAEIFSRWGRLRWLAETPRGAGLEIEVRSGNTQAPGETWSAWRPLGTQKGVSEADVPSPPARFLQWRARLRADSGSAGPRLRDVEAYYRQRNVEPEIPSVRLEDPGVVILPVQVQPAAQQQQTGAAVRRNPGPQGVRRATRRAFEKGKQTVSWTARDRNQDTLRYELFYRRADEERWKPLKTGVEEEFLAFDTTSLPDGKYVVRVVASDRPSNPPAEALTAEAESEPFVIDNTPPRVQSLRASVRGSRVELSFEVEDSYSPVEGAEYALDGGDWSALNPLDGVADAPRESYKAEVEVGPGGAYTLGVRATDQMGNRGAGHVQIEAP